MCLKSWSVMVKVKLRNGVIIRYSTTIQPCKHSWKNYLRPSNHQNDWTWVAMFHKLFFCATDCPILPKSTVLYGTGNSDPCWNGTLSFESEHIILERGKGWSFGCPVSVQCHLLQCIFHLLQIFGRTLPWDQKNGLLRWGVCSWEVKNVALVHVFPWDHDKASIHRRCLPRRYRCLLAEVWLYNVHTCTMYILRKHPLRQCMLNGIFLRRLGHLLRIHVSVGHVIFKIQNGPVHKTDWSHRRTCRTPKQSIVFEGSRLLWSFCQWLFCLCFSVLPSNHLFLHC